MDAGLHGWGPPRCSGVPCTKVHCHERALYFNSTFFLIKQLVANSKKRLEAALWGKQNGLKKDRSLLVFFEYSINHNNRTSV